MRAFKSKFSVVAGLLALVALAADGRAQDQTHDELDAGVRGAACDPCDVNCDRTLDGFDITPFVETLLDDRAGCSACGGDFDGNGMVDGWDIQPFVVCMLAQQSIGACCEPSASCFLTTQVDCQGNWLGPDSTCDLNPCVTGDLTAYRPQHGDDYFPFARTPVPDVEEENAILGPGIRINSPGDSDPVSEDDLIEVTVEIDEPGAAVALRRSSASLSVWTTRTKDGDTEILFVNNKSSAIPFGVGETVTTVWVEWSAATHGTADLQLEPLIFDTPLDTLRFHSFKSIVMALGGEGQVPSVPVDPNHGVFVVAVDLYSQGYDVHIHDEDEVSSDGSGVVFNEVVNAVQNRLVDEIGIFGYSHGGGSTYDLADRLDANRAGIGLFEIAFTSYADAVENDSDIDIQQELRRPPSSGYHANHYQNGSLADFFLDGGPVPDSNPPPTGLNVETAPWGVGSTHFEVDDFVQVRDFVETNLLIEMSP